MAEIRGLKTRHQRENSGDDEMRTKTSTSSRALKSHLCRKTSAGCACKAEDCLEDQCGGKRLETTDEG